MPKLIFCRRIRNCKTYPFLVDKSGEQWYDKDRNITQIADGSGVIQNKYYYDSLGQLVREDNRAQNRSYIYEYDEIGNPLKIGTYFENEGC